MRVFQDQDAASAHLDSPGHRLRHFCSGENAARTQLVMLANLTRHRWSNCWPWPSALVVQVRVVKSGTSILSRSDWPSSQVALQVPVFRSEVAAVRLQVQSQVHQTTLIIGSSVACQTCMAQAALVGDLMASCGTGKSSRLSFLIRAACSFVQLYSWVNIKI